MLKRQPDFSTVWNYRREILLHNHPLSSKDGQSDEKALRAVFEQDLELVAFGLRNKNPKSYSLWHHRRWIVSQWIERVPTSAKDMLTKELALCTKFLKYDERNFHCWNYRAFIVKLAKLGPEADLDFTQEKILENFSNYSALHRRLRALKALFAPPAKTTAASFVERLDAELEMAQQAVFTEPDDQSSWMYIRALFEWARERNVDADVIASRGEGIVKCCRELVEMEGPLKWPLLTEMYMLKAHAVESETKSNTARISEILPALIDVDPVHRVYYESIAKE